MNKLIKCSDKNTIEQLIQLGYEMIDERDGIVTFLNDTSKPQTFDKQKIVYSNILIM